MKILVTGGAGFIGGHVVDKFIALGHDVTVLDDLSTGRRQNLNPKASLIQMSLLDERLPEAFKAFAPEAVVHHAAQVNVRRSVDDPTFDASVNVLGSIKLYQCAAQFGTRKVIYASSGGACYGEPEKIPADENTAIRPQCPYGCSKFVAEKYLALFSDLYGFRYTILRYANVYGPRQDPHGEAGVVAIFAEQMLDGKTPTIFGDGTKTRDYVYVEDIAQANALALSAGDGRTYNVGIGREISDDLIFTSVRDALGANIKPIYGEFRKGEVTRIALDATRLRTELGWSPQTTFEQGIAKAVEYYRAKRR